MKILSRISLMQLHPLIMGLNYRNIHAALVEMLPEDEGALFAKVDMNSTEAIWFVDGKNNNYTSLTSASEEMREDVLDWLAEKKQMIIERVKTNRQIADHAELLFRIPSQDHIFYAVTDDNQLSVVLTQWGMLHKNRGTEVDVIGILLSTPRNNFIKATLLAQYKEGAPAIGERVSIQVFAPKTYTIDNNGKVFLGRMRVGLPFTVRFGDREMAFKIEENQTEYSVIIPRYTTAVVQVVNQLDEPLQKIDLLINGCNYLTDIDGNIKVPSFEYHIDDTLHVALASGEAASKNFPLEWDGEKNCFRYIIEERIDCSLHISVIDENGNKVANYPIHVNAPPQRNCYQTEENGTVLLDSMNFKQDIEVNDGNDPNNRIVICLEKGLNHCTLQIALPDVVPDPPAPIEHEVRIKLLNIDGSDMEGIEIKVKTKKGELIRTSDSEGYIYLPASHFKDGEKVIAKFYVLNNQLKDGKEGKKS